MTIHQESDLQGSHRIFLITFGAFGIVHWMIYAFWWQYDNHLSLQFVGAFGVYLLLKPGSMLALSGLATALAIDGWLQAPVFSNHTMLKNFMVLGLACAGGEALLRGRKRDWCLRRFATYGCLLLLGLYFFGIFHKINTGFLDPEVSCAVALWQEMPLPRWITESSIVHQAAVYGTFVIEGLIALCLILKRFRHLGIIVGIGFHMLLASSSYEFYSAFTVLTVALHVLFLPEDAHRTMLSDPVIRRMVEWFRSPLGLTMTAVYVAALTLYSAQGMLTSVGLGTFVATLPLIIAIWRTRQVSERPFSSFSIKSVWQPVLVALFLFNGFAPYMGIKTAQSFNMFANLRLEGGRSNHLIFSAAPDRYLPDTVQVLDSHLTAWRTHTTDPHIRVTYYDFLNQMERAPTGASAQYRLNDGEPESRTREELQPEFERVLHPRWVRKWLHFTPIDVSEPKRCGVNF